MSSCVETSRGSLLHLLCVADARCHHCCAGIRAIAGQDEPIGRQISKMEVADGLILEKVRSIGFSIGFSPKLHQTDCEDALIYSVLFQMKCNIAMWFMCQPTSKSF